MRIVVIGPGAMGCLLAAFLSRKQKDVCLLDKNEERAKKIRRKGVRVEGVSGKWHAKIFATHDVKEFGSADLIIICTKAYDTRQAIERARDIVDENTYIMTLQNGIGNYEVIAEMVGSEKVIAGITSHGSTLLGEGYVRHAGKGETVIGRVDGRVTAFMRNIRRVFDRASIETRISKDITSIIWSKLIINTGINALAAITRLRNGRLIEFDGARWIMREAIREAVEVADRKGIRLIFDPFKKVEYVCRATAGNIASMLQDVIRKKRTEIDFINGVIVREGRALGISTPVNELLLSVVSVIEQGYNESVDSLS
jgi:2-dehydropantoate 2-reductase